MKTVDVIQLLTVLEPVLLALVNALVEIFRARALVSGAPIDRAGVVAETLPVVRAMYESGIYKNQFDEKFTWAAGDDEHVASYLHGLVAGIVTK